MRFFTRFIRVIAISSMLCMLLFTSLSILLISTKPTLSPQPTADAQHYMHAQKRLQAMLENIQQSQSTFTLTLDQADIASLNHIANSQASSNTRSQAHLANTALHIRISQPLFRQFLWINMNVRIASGSEIKLSQLKVGAIPIPNKLTQYLLNKASLRTLGVHTDTINYYIIAVAFKPNKASISARKPALINFLLKDYKQRLTEKI